MVSLPYTEVRKDWEISGCPRPLILDQLDTTSPAELVRRAIEQEGGGILPLAPSFAERIARQLAGTLDSGNRSIEDPQQSEDAQDQLTERQAVLLRTTRSLPRIKFTGGAGSGKTWLAVEKTRLLCREGKRVGLFCYNKGLSQYLQDRVSSWRQAKPMFTGEFHEYARLLGVPDGSGQTYFEEEMPRLLKECATHLEPHKRLDAVVVDEAQDFAPLWWEALLACRANPDSGDVYAFLDDHQDVYRRWNGILPEPGKYPTAGLVPIHIDDNLRNTRRIAETFKSFAGEHFTPRGSTGLPVRRVQCATEDAMHVAEDCLDALIGEGWANNQIALLTTRERHPIHRDFFDRDATAEYWQEFHANEREFYGHVLGFKGLEPSVVILCVNGFKDMGRASEQLYVGLSRARSLLVVVGDSALMEQAGGRGLAMALSRAQNWHPKGD